jgi:(p)ppGpp synthase/HD superfamily hydrolase
MEKTITERATKLAELAHHNQKRRNGEPYILHPRRVAAGVEGWDTVSADRVKAIAILHDVLEDTPFTQQDLREAGIPEHVIAPVVLLTRGEKENYFDYITRLRDCGHNDVILVKLSDLNDNLIDLEEGSMKDKYRFAQYMLRQQITGP